MESNMAWMTWLPHCVFVNSQFAPSEPSYQKYFCAYHRVAGVYYHGQPTDLEHTKNFNKMVQYLRDDEADRTPPRWVFGSVMLGLIPKALGYKPQWTVPAVSVAALSWGARYWHNTKVWWYGWRAGPYTVITAVCTGIPWAEDEVTLNQIPVWEKLGYPVALVFHRKWRRRLALWWYQHSAPTRATD